MKLMLAVISQSDANAVTRKLTDEGHSVTRLATTGGFLRAKNVTILVGVEDEDVQAVLDTLGRYSHSRTEKIVPISDPGLGFYPSTPIEVTVGGATVFVLDVDRFEKL